MADASQKSDRTTTPRYRVVAQALMRDLERGKFKVGSMLPTEMEICTRFNISRHTAREAIRRLTDAGMVTRRAGVGTTITARTVASRYTADISDPGELIAFTRQTRLDLLSQQLVNVKGELATVLPEAAGERWLSFTLRRFVADSVLPIGYAQILVHPSFEAIQEKMQQPDPIVYRLIEEMQGERIAELKQEITCVSLSGKIATLLDARPGTPALRVLRYYLGANGSVLSVAINTYPRARFKLTTRWKLDASSATDH